jgi:hypothetical protein
MIESDDGDNYELMLRSSSFASAAAVRPAQLADGVDLNSFSAS